MPTMKRPSFQFYAGDWLKDPAVRAVSLAARGLWIDMLCLMDQSPRRGFLQHVSGQPVSAMQLARMTGCSPDEVLPLLQELDNAGVFSSTDNGIVFSRRMTRDERKRQLCAEAGKKGGGNPTFIGQSKGGTKGGPKRNPKASSSVSSSSSENLPSEDSKPPLPPKTGKFDPVSVEIPPLLDSKEFREAWENWVRHRRDIKKPLTPTSVEQQLREFASWGIPRSIKAIEFTILKGWQGIREDDRSQSQPAPQQTELERRRAERDRRLRGGTDESA